MRRPLWRLPLIALRERIQPPGRARVPELMVMDTADSVDQFHQGGEAVGGMIAVYDFSARALDALMPEGGRLLDLGVGSGRALQRFLAMRPDVDATGVDLAPNMLATAREFLESSGLGSRVSLVQADMTALPQELIAERWDAVSCVWCLHHLPNRDVLRAALRQIAQFAGMGCALWLLDFYRLRHPQTARSLIMTTAPSTPPVLFADAVASEAAAFTHEELSEELEAVGLGGLHSGITRPIPWLQAFWSSAGTSGRSPEKVASIEPLPNSARVDALFLRMGFSNRPF